MPDEIQQVETTTLPEDGDIRKPLTTDIESKVVNFEDFHKIIREQDPNAIEPKPEEKKDDKEIKVETKEKEIDSKQEGLVKDGKIPEGDSKIREGKQEDKVLSALNDDKIKYGDAAAFFPKMAKEAREFLKARLDEVKNLQDTVKDLKTKSEAKVEGELPSSYLDHPQAYTLDPKFAQVIKTRENVNMELNYWQQQLVAIRNADKWQDLRRDGQGNLVQVEMDAGPQADVLVSSRINQALRILENQESVINNLQTSFKSRYDASRNSMAELERQYFPMYEGDKGKDNKYIKTFVDLLSDKGQKDNILTSPFAKLYALTMEQAEYIKANQEKWKAAETTGKVIAQSGPNSGDLNGAGEKKSVSIDQKPFDYEEFKRMKEV